MDTTVKYIKPNGSTGYFRTEKTGMVLAQTLRSVEQKGNRLIEVNIPYVGTLTGSRIAQFILHGK